MLTLQQMIGDFGELERRVKLGLQGVTASKPAIDSLIETTATEMIANAVAAELSAEFIALIETQEAVSGPRNGEGTNPDDWESQVDDAVCEVLKNGYQDVVGAGYAGGISVDTRLHEPHRPEELAREIATQFAKDIVKRDRETILTLVSIPLEAAGTAPAAPDANQVGAARSVVLIVLASALRKPDADPLAIYDDLDLASDEDEGLALGAMQRIAADFVNTTEIRASLKLTRRVGGLNWRDSLIDEATVMADAPAPTAEKPAKKPRKKKGEKTEDPAHVEAAQPAAEQQDDGMSDEDRAFLAELEGEAAPLPLVEVSSLHDGDAVAEPTSEEAVKILTACKEFLPMSEKDLAEVMGFSRATLNNICAGKSKLNMTAEQREALSGILRKNLVGLQEILTDLDGGV